MRRRAVSILDRVQSLSHVSGDFAPLRTCQDKARALCDAIAERSPFDQHEDVERLAEGDHAFAHLLILLDDHEELDDELWANYHESILRAFGKPLAAAAARMKVVLSADSETEASPDQGELHPRHFGKISANNA